MTMIVSRRLARYAAFVTVVLLVCWTTTSSHASYRFLSQQNPWLGHGNDVKPTTVRPTLDGLDSTTQKKEDRSRVEQTPTITSSSHEESGIEAQVEKGQGGHQHHNHDHLHKPQTGHSTGLPSMTLTTDVSSSTTTYPKSATNTIDSSSTNHIDAGQEENKAGGVADQNKQAQVVLEKAPLKLNDQNITLARVHEYLESILHLNMTTTVDRLECPGEMSERPRYEVLRRNTKSEPKKIKYLFAMDLYQSIEIMPRLLSTVVQAARFLGPENCAISIVEGRSTDGTYVVLRELAGHLSKLGIRFWLQQSSLNPKNGDLDRVEALARLRNMAFAPLINETYLFSKKPLLVFINDIVPCPDDVYEMIYQHELQDAVQTCAMDWIEKGENFYDVWVSRSMTGDTFWEIPQDGSWVFVQNLFFDDPYTKDKYTRGMPFQVFSCWGGMTVIEGSPFITDSINLRIRRNYKGECYGGEPQLLGSDLAKYGISRVQTLPEVNVGYSNKEGSQVKKLRKYVHERVDVNKLVEKYTDDNTTERIKWKPPPTRYRCMPDFRNHWWVDAWYDSNKED